MLRALGTYSVRGCQDVSTVFVETAIMWSDGDSAAGQHGVTTFGP